jgi:hypothetical protein
MSALAPKGIFEDEEIYVCERAEPTRENRWDDFSIPDEDCDWAA